MKKSLVVRSREYRECNFEDFSRRFQCFETSYIVSIVSSRGARFVRSFCLPKCSILSFNIFTLSAVLIKLHFKIIHNPSLRIFWRFRPKRLFY